MNRKNRRVDGSNPLKAKATESGGAKVFHGNGGKITP
jgi:hypothetical protein